MLILQWWICQTGPKFSLIRVWRNKINGQTKISSILYDKWFNSFTIEESGQAEIITHIFDLQNLFPDIEIDSLQVFILLLFVGDGSVPFYYLETWLFFTLYLYNIFHFVFSAILNFRRSTFFPIMTCLNLIGRNKLTMSLIVSVYSLANIMLEAAIMRRFC